LPGLIVFLLCFFAVAFYS